MGFALILSKSSWDVIQSCLWVLIHLKLMWKHECHILYWKTWNAPEWRFSSCCIQLCVVQQYGSFCVKHNFEMMLELWSCCTNLGYLVYLKAHICARTVLFSTQKFQSSSCAWLRLSFWIMSCSNSTTKNIYIIKILLYNADFVMLSFVKRRKYF